MNEKDEKELDYALQYANLLIRGMDNCSYEVDRAVEEKFLHICNYIEYKLQIKKQNKPEEE